MDDKILEQVYQENLEERLIAYIADENSISLEEAMKIYYESKLSNKINQGNEGIQYLDYKVLAEILKETEPELFLQIKDFKTLRSFYNNNIIYLIMTDKDIDYACNEMKKCVPEVLHDHLIKMIVYGSVARKDYNDDSDVDIAILTNLDREEVKKYDSALMDIVTNIAMHNGTIVEYICLPYSEFESKKSWYGYFKKIEKDGVHIFG